MRVRSVGLACFAALVANAQQLDMPRDTEQRLPSPDGSRVLYGVPYQKSGSVPQLWIEDTRTHRRTKLFDIASTLSAAWSADGAKFYVNDHLASDSELSYIYDAATLQRIDLAARIQAEDPRSRPFANDHAYFEIRGWEGKQNVAVSFFGHTTGPVVCFNFRYRISKAGVVNKLSQRITPATTTFCDESP
jgi:hypothetical protein